MYMIEKMPSVISNTDTVTKEITKILDKIACCQGQQMKQIENKRMLSVISNPDRK